jgi:hypothetical protein
LSAGAFTVIGLVGATSAGAVNNNPAGNPTSPAVSYESDCTSTLQAGVAAPFISSTVINTTADSLKPTGATFGVAGAVSQTLAGPVIAGLNGALNPATIGLGVTETFGSEDGHATGTSAYTHTFASVANPGGTVAAVTFASGATTLTGNFAAVPANASLSGTGIPASAVSTAAGTATSITISAATTAASTGETVGWAPLAGLTFTDAAFATAPNAFTTAGLNGQTAGIGVISSSNFTVVTPAISVAFGAGSGVGANNCLVTGWQSATQPGPPQTGGATPPDETAPAFPFGTTTALVLATGGFITQPGTTQAITLQPGAFVNLATTPPTPQPQSVAMGEGGTATVTLTATPGSFPVGSFVIVGGGTQTITLTGGGTLSIAQVGTSATVNLSNTSTVATSGSFQFNACDTSAPPVCSTTPATVTVNIGSPPVVQPFSEVVNGAQLVLSCNSPANYITGNNTPTPVGTPLLQCPEFQFQPITLDGLEQQVTAATGNTGGVPGGSNPGTIYISDNRGSPTGTWTLTGTFIATPTGTGAGQNPNASCGGIDAFCNSSVGTAATNTATNGAHDGQIAPNYLQVSGISCIADPTGGPAPYNPPNLNPNATPTAGGAFGSPVNLCTAAVGQSGGTFIYNATYTLTIPESVYAGNYIGSVRYTVA